MDLVQREAEQNEGERKHEIELARIKVGAVDSGRADGRMIKSLYQR